MKKSTPDKTILNLEQVSKKYANTVALNKVDFSCKAGEIHAIIGENGAGKSTLIKILAGVVNWDEGTYLLNGNTTKFKDPREAESEGVVAVFQELSLIPHLTVYENIYLGNEYLKNGLVDYNKMQKNATILFEELNFDIDANALVSELSLEKKQLVEIAKAIAKNPKIIIFDEATSALDTQQVQNLFVLIRKLKEQGKTIIFISHRMDELEQITDRASVFRDAQYITTFDWGTVSNAQIIDWVVGEKTTYKVDAEIKSKKTQEQLVIENLCVDKTLDNINLTIYKGEILGIAGLKGHGQSEFLYALFGALAVTQGDISLDGKLLKKLNPKKCIKNGIALVPEERKTEGLILSRSVKENMALMTLDIRSLFGFIKVKQELDDVAKITELMHIKAENPDVSSGSLSGGNQQKIVLGKAILTGAKVLLLADPTRGIDIGAKREIYKVMRQLAQDGISVVFYSTETSELVDLCDRVAVFKGGQIVTVLESENLSEHAIIGHALGLNN